MKTNRTIAYIDGFNLYFGLHDKGWKCYYWLNLWRLCGHLLKPSQTLVAVKYFTSKIRNPPDKRRRQYAYLRALEMTHGIQRFFGKYEVTPFICEKCGHKVELAEEKMSDVQLATQLVSDALTNKFDVALLVTGDRDLVPALEVVRQETPKKRIVMAFPPMRSCDDLRYAAHAYIHVTESVLETSLFPDVISDSVGNAVVRPQEWA
jgi:uncharacterized LabA/DUF88 family protein